MRPTRCLCLRASNLVSSPSPPTGVFSRPQDAISSAERSLLLSNQPPTPRAPKLWPSAKPQRRQQRQTLTDAEAEGFHSLLMTQSLLTPAQTRLDLQAPIHDAINAKTYRRNVQLEEREREKRRKQILFGSAQRPLTKEEEEKLSEMKEVMDIMTDDFELLKMALADIFGVGYGWDGDRADRVGRSLVPNVKQALIELAKPSSPSTSKRTTPTAGPLSPLYPHLLPHLFDLVSSSPTIAAHVFHLSTFTPESYVRGCTPALYSALMTLRWKEGADIEGVLRGVEEMRTSGVRTDHDLKRLVAEIGQAVRRDQERAEKIVAAEMLQQHQGAQSAEVVAQVDPSQYRYFSSTQVAAWAQMDRIVSEITTEEENMRIAKKRIEREEQAREIELRERRDRVEAEANSPTLFSGGLRKGAYRLLDRSGDGARRKRGMGDSDADRYIAERRARRQKEEVRKVDESLTSIWRAPIE